MSAKRTPYIHMNVVSNFTNSKLGCRGPRAQALHSTVYCGELSYSRPRAKQSNIAATRSPTDSLPDSRGARAVAQLASRFMTNRVQFCPPSPEAADYATFIINMGVSRQIHSDHIGVNGRLRRSKGSHSLTRASRDVIRLSSLQSGLLCAPYAHSRQALLR